MKKEMMDKERLEDVRRKRMLLGIAAMVIVMTVLISVSLSRMAVHNVDTKTGVSKIKELEKTDVTETEKQIEAIEMQEKQEDEAWKNRPLSEKFANAVVLGDSITTGFTGYEILDSSKVVAEKGIHLYELGDLIDTAAELNPQVLFLALGLNDVSLTDGDTEAFVAAYQTVVNTLREKLPDTKIYVNSILPVTEEVTAKGPVYVKIPDYNTALQEMCKKEGLTFIDNTGIVKAEYYEPDGEHMRKEYYPVWGEHMAEVAGI